MRRRPEGGEGAGEGAAEAEAGTRRRITLAAFVVGLGILVGVVAWQGAGIVFEALAGAGWRMLWLPAFFVVVPLPLAVMSWGALFAPEQRPGPGALTRATWIGWAVNWLLPVAQMGGEVVKVRLLLPRGTDGAVAGASVVVDKTLQAAVQAVGALAGLALLVAVRPDPRLVGGAVVGLVVLAGLTVLFLRVQQRGLFEVLAGIAARAGLAGGALGGTARDADAALRATWRDRGRVLRAFAWRLASRMTMVLEIWLALRFLGVEASVVDAAIVDLLGQAIRAAAFLVPAGIGIQEGGFALLAAAVGISPGLGIALSLARRVREVVVGVPALLAWQAEEGGRLLRGRPPG